MSESNFRSLDSSSPNPSIRSITSARLWGCAPISKLESESSPRCVQFPWLVGCGIRRHSAVAGALKGRVCHLELPPLLQTVQVPDGSMWKLWNKLHETAPSLPASTVQVSNAHGTGYRIRPIGSEVKNEADSV